VVCGNAEKNLECPVSRGVNAFRLIITITIDGARLPQYVRISIKQLGSTVRDSLFALRDFVRLLRHLVGH